VFGYHPSFLRKKRVDWAKGRQRKKKEKEKRGGGTKVLLAIRTNSLSNFSSKRGLPMECPFAWLFFQAHFRLPLSQVHVAKLGSPNC